MHRATHTDQPHHTEAKHSGTGGKRAAVLESPAEVTVQVHSQNRRQYPKDYKNPTGNYIVILYSLYMHYVLYNPSSLHKRCPQTDTVKKIVN